MPFVWRKWRQSQSHRKFPDYSSSMTAVWIWKLAVASSAHYSQTNMVVNCKWLSKDLMEVEEDKVVAVHAIRTYRGNRCSSVYFFFQWHYIPLWALACQTMSFHFFLSATNSLHLLTPNTWRSLSASSFHPFLGLPLLLVPSSSWVKTFLGILSSSILSRWPNQLILFPFIQFTIFSPLLISSSSWFVRLFHSAFSYLGQVSLHSFIMLTLDGGER